QEETHDVLDRGGHVREHRHLVAELSVTGRILLVDPGDVRRKIARGNKAYARHAVLPSGCALGYGRSLADKRRGFESIFWQEALGPIDQEQDEPEADQDQGDGGKLGGIEHIEEVFEEARAFDEDHEGRGAE